jgi:hypothetical protein
MANAMSRHEVARENQGLAKVASDTPKRSVKLLQLR